MSTPPRPSTLRCLSLNVNGLADPTKRRFLLASLDPYDIILLQETHQRATDNTAEWPAFGRAQVQRFPGQGFFLRNTLPTIQARIPTCNNRQLSQLPPASQLTAHVSRLPLARHEEASPPMEWPSSSRIPHGSQTPSNFPSQIQTADYFV